MSGKPRKRALFTREDGGPMCFSLMPCPERKEIRDLIEHGGGLLLQPDRLPNAIRLVPSFFTTTTDSSDDVFSANYIRACSENNKLYPLKDFKVPTSPILADDGDRKERTLRSIRSRREYTLGEDITIAKFIAKKQGARIKGNEVYKEMVAAGVVPGKHSWQSLKQRYLKTIEPMRHLYESPDAVSSLAERLAKESGKDRGSSRSDTLNLHSYVLVEDSGSEDDCSRKRKRQAAHELESSEDAGADTEVIAETESQHTSPPVQHETPARKCGYHGEDEKLKNRSIRDRNSSSVSPVACSCEGASNTQGFRQKVSEQKAGKKVDDVQCENRREGPGEVLTEKLKLRTSLRRVQKKTSARSSDNTVQAQSHPGINSGASRAADPGTVVGPSPVRSNEQKTLWSSPKTRRNSVLGCPGAHPSSAQAQADSSMRKIDSDDVLEVSSGLGNKQTPQPPTAKGTRRKLKARFSGRSRKRSSRHSSSSRSERKPSPGSTRQPLRSSPRKLSRSALQENSGSQSGTQPHPKSSTDNDGAPETDSENSPGPACVAEGPNLRTAPALDGRKKKGVFSPHKGSEEQRLLSGEQKTVLPTGKRNSSRLRMRNKPVMSAKGSDEVPHVDSSATSVPNSGCAPEHTLSCSNEHRLPPSSLRKRQSAMSPTDLGDHLSTRPYLESDHDSSAVPEADSKDLSGRTRAAKSSKLRTTLLPKIPKKKGVPSRRKESDEHGAHTEERETEALMGTRTPSFVHKQNEPLSPTKGSDKVPHIRSSAKNMVDSARTPERMSALGGKLRLLRSSPRKRAGTTSHSQSGSRLCTEPHLESDHNDGAASEKDSEDPLGLGRMVEGSLLRAALLPDKTEAIGVSSTRKGSTEQVTWAEKCEPEKNLTRNTASPLLHKQSRPKKSSKKGGVKSEANAADNEEDPDTGQLDSADEALLARVTKQAPASPMWVLDSADEDLLARIAEPCNDNASTVTLSSEPSMASTVTIQSSNDSSQEDIVPGSEPDCYARERQELAKLLGILQEGKKQPPHAAVCPLQCNCPRSTSYIHAARSAVALSALLASHDSLLPSECPGAKDPKVILLLEVLLRRLEGGEVNNGESC